MTSVINDSCGVIHDSCVVINDSCVVIHDSVIHDSCGVIHDSSYTDLYDPNTRVDIHTFRFKLSDPFTDELALFSKIHQYDDRKTFKTEWNEWLEAHLDIVNEEATRLSQAGYTGDAIKKMFVSARYYFRNKPTGSTAQVGRKKYVRLDSGALRAMDEHILHHVIPKSLKPHDGYLEFCKSNADMLLSGDADKIKKTYKNRYSKLSLALAKA